MVVSEKVAFNLFIQCVFVTLPVAYLLQSILVEGQKLEPEQQQQEEQEQHVEEESYEDVIIMTASLSSIVKEKVLLIIRTQQEQQQKIYIPSVITTAYSNYLNDIRTQGLLWKCWSLWGPAML